MAAAKMQTAPLFSEYLEEGMVPEDVLASAASEDWHAYRDDLTPITEGKKETREKHGLKYEPRVLSPAEVTPLTFEVVAGVTVAIIRFRGALRIDSTGIRSILDHSLLKAQYPAIYTERDDLSVAWRDVREAHQRQKNEQGFSQDVLHENKSYFPIKQGRMMFEEYLRHPLVRDEIAHRYPETGRRAIETVTTIANGLMNSVIDRVNDLTELSKKPDLR